MGKVNYLLPEKRKQTNIERYGVDCYTKTDEYITKSKNTYIQNCTNGKYQKLILTTEDPDFLNFMHQLKSMTLLTERELESPFL